jgi:hypothetical protein
MEEPSWTPKPNPVVSNYCKKLAAAIGVKYMTSKNFKMSTEMPYRVTLKDDDNWKLRCLSKEKLWKMMKEEYETYFYHEAVMNVDKNVAPYVAYVNEKGERSWLPLHDVLRRD